MDEGHEKAISNNKHEKESPLLGIKENSIKIKKSQTLRVLNFF